MKSKEKNITPMENYSNYEKFIKGKEVNNNGKALFDKAIKKATTTKQRGSI